MTQIRCRNIDNQIIEEIKKNQNLWELFTKKEEYSPVELDNEGRFGYKFSTHKDVLKPYISEYLLSKGFSAEYPEQKKFAVVLTHDIDDVYVKLGHIFSAIPNCFRYGNFKGFKSLISGKINKKKSPYINFQQIIDIEEKYNAKSSFYFLVSPDSDFGNNYYAKDLEPIIKKIIDRDCEIGYHTRYHIYDNVEEIKKEKKTLETITGKKIIGVRNHHLRFKTPDSWNVLANAGFSYDSTFHYNDMVGFRNGMCHPYYPFDLNKHKKIEILEIPLVVSDIAFRSFMKTNVSESWDYIKRLIDVVEKNNGVMTILWHSWTYSLPISVAGWFGREWTELYQKILKYCSEKNAWITDCEELYKYDKKEGVLKH